MVLAIGAVDDRVHERLAAHGPVVEVAPDDREAIARRLPEADGIVARAAAVIDAELIVAAPRSARHRTQRRRRSSASTSRPRRAAGIPVVITPNGGTRGVAEGALALMLHLVKRLGPLTTLVREGRWAERDTLPLGDLDGATLAVIGYGRIGRRVAELASAFGMHVLAHDPYADDAGAELRGRAGRGRRDQPARAAHSRDPRPDRRGRADGA